MEKTVTLNNGLPIPQIGTGTYMLTDHEECKKSVLNALKIGYRHVDTAQMQMYRNESAVGEAIKESGVPREDIFITTKIWVTDYGNGKTKEAIQRSLNALQIDYIDSVLLHQPFNDYIGAWKELEEAVRAGTIKSIGISNFDIRRTQEILNIAKIIPTVNQVECHPYSQQNELRSFLAQQDILIEAWYPLGHGDKKLINEPTFGKIAKKYGKSNVQVILRWHIQKGHIVFPKASNPAHGKDNMNIFDFSLTDDEMAQITALDKKKPYDNSPEFLKKIVFRFLGPSKKS